ncbi:putative RNA-directed DNA polymerase from transposon X-element [Caerostris extrusa]|uniref:RNA-directed DNA polymerase from transposon X-element n=1 Tax=Caerostris extrusa TaxID=172846 RepID=A0AAV4XST1_CAEEX|nr:putative RNA-directed DNA polymerase from transposon X-element [Caerostris extrusa]
MCLKFNSHNRNNRNLQYLRFGFWNASVISSKFEEIKEFISDHELDIFLHQETFLRPGLTPEIPNFTLYRTNRTNTGTYRTYGGTCIYAKNDLVHHQKPSLELRTIENPIMELKLENTPPITFISTYVKATEFLIK